MKLSIDTDGSVTFIYTDELADLCSEGLTDIKRVSNVEPDSLGGWSATMLDGKKLGPYTYRWQALEEEVKYLEAKLF